MAISDFNKVKALDVASVSGTPSVSLTVPIKLTSGDDSTTGTGEIVLDWTNISSKADIGVYDSSDALVDYYFESFDSGSQTAVIHVYKSWVRDGTTQLKLGYGGGASDQSVSASTVFDKEQTNSDLICGWLLNESSGDSLDVTSNNYDGTVSGATQGVTGQVDGAYDFDGVDDYVDIPDDVGIGSTTQPYSVSAWVKQVDPNDGNHRIVVAVPNRNSNLRNRYGSGNMEFHVKNSDDSHVRVEASISANTWTHFVGVFDGDFIRIYKNGNEVDNLDLSGDEVETGDAGGSQGYIGSWTGGDNLWEGGVDDVRIYGRDLSSDEITAKYDASKPTPDFFSQQAASGGGTDASGLLTTVTYSVLQGTTSKIANATGTKTDITVQKEQGITDKIANIIGNKVSYTISTLQATATRVKDVIGSKASYALSTLQATTSKIANVSANKISFAFQSLVLSAGAFAQATKASLNMATFSKTTEGITDAVASKAAYTYNVLQGAAEGIQNIVVSKAAYSWDVFQGAAEGIQDITASKISITFNALQSIADRVKTAAVNKIQITIDTLEGALTPVTIIAASKASLAFNALQSIGEPLTELPDVVGNLYVKLTNLFRYSILDNERRYAIMSQYTFKQGDFADTLEATLEDDNGAIDLGDYTSVYLYIRDRDGNTVLSGESCSIDNASAGEVSYSWQSGDPIETPGIYEIEFEIEGSDGKITVPNDDKATITVEEDIR